MASAYAFGNVTDESSCRSSSNVLVLHVLFILSTPMSSERMVVLCDIINLPDLIEWAGTKTVKQVLEKKMTYIRIGEI